MSLLSLMLGQPQGGILGQASIRPQVQQNGLLGRDPWQQMPPGPQLAAGPGFKIPSGYMPDPNNPEGIVSIPGHKAERFTPEQASKIQMMRGAQSRLPMAKKLLFNPDGSVDSTNITTSRIGGGIPYTEGAELATVMEEGVQALTRGETGAAMPESEVDNVRKRFQPNVFDSDAVVRLKWQMYQDAINGSLQLTDPQGRFSIQKLDTELNSRMKNIPEDDPAPDSGWKIERVD
jgi:hypothetical protein